MVVAEEVSVRTLPALRKRRKWFTSVDVIPVICSHLFILASVMQEPPPPKADELVVRIMYMWKGAGWSLGQNVGGNNDAIHASYNMR